MKPEANLEEIYATVRQHMLTQGRRSERVNADGTVTCLYRHPSGDMCAVGCLIPDDAYSADIEGTAVDCTEVLDSLPFRVNDDVLAFLGDLQALHDHECVDHWADELEWLARQHCIIA